MILICFNFSPPEGGFSNSVVCPMKAFARKSETSIYSMYLTVHLERRKQSIFLPMELKGAIPKYGILETASLLSQHNTCILQPCFNPKDNAQGSWCSMWQPTILWNLILL